MTQHAKRRRALLFIPILALAACGGAEAAADAEPTTTWEPTACNDGDHQSTPEAYYECVDGAWVPGKAPTPTTTTPPATVPPTAPPTTAPPTSEAPTTVPPTTQPVPTTTPPPPPPGPDPTINITCPTPKSSGADSLRADFGYDFHATTPALVRWGIEYGDGRSYTADDEAKARTQVFWHHYRSPGTYTVTAWVEDAIGRRASGSCQFTWTQPPPAPTKQPPAPQPKTVPDPPHRFKQNAEGPFAPPVVLTGSGSAVVPLPSRDFYVATITHDGGSNFKVWTLDDALQQTGLLVNEIGPYSGRLPINLLNGDNAAQLEITADGNWSVTLEPGATGIRRFGQDGASGTGSDVLFSETSNVFNVTHDGESNFIVWNYTATDSDLVVNEINGYTGQHVISQGVLVITADGVWTIVP